MAKQSKVPLRIDLRVKLVKALLNSKMTCFDFAVLGSPELINKEEYDDFYVMWQNIFDDFWTELAAKCPGLLEVREFRPRDESNMETALELDRKVYSFSKLSSLETNSFINAG